MVGCRQAGQKGNGTLPGWSVEVVGLQLLLSKAKVFQTVTVIPSHVVVKLDKWFSEALALFVSLPQPANVRADSSNPATKRQHATQCGGDPSRTQPHRWRPLKSAMGMFRCNHGDNALTQLTPAETGSPRHCPEPPHGGSVLISSISASRPNCNLTEGTRSPLANVPCHLRVLPTSGGIPPGHVFPATICATTPATMTALPCSQSPFAFSTSESLPKRDARPAQ